MELVTSEEFRRRARISEATEWRLRKAGRIAYTQIGRRVRYTEAQVAAFLASCEKRATTTPS